MGCTWKGVGYTGPCAKHDINDDQDITFDARQDSTSEAESGQGVCMKITKMNVTPVAIADAPLRNAPGIHEPYVNRIIVELFGEDGLSGWGEAAFSTAMYKDLLALRPHIEGRDALNQSDLARQVTAYFGGSEGDRRDPIFANFVGVSGESNRAIPRTFSPIEVAALDLSGRALGIPVSDLLGGAIRETVPFSAYLFYKHAGGGGEGDDIREDVYGEAMSPEGVVAQAKQMVETYGFRSIKLKAGVFEPMQEVEGIKALRAAFGPDVPLRIDPNCAWTVETSLKVGRALADDLEYFEDPTGGIPGMAEVRKGLLAEGIDIPNATNMCVTAFSHIPESVKVDAVQIILGDHHYWGGLRATVELGRICSTFGLGMSMHSNSHLGISLAAMTQVAAATPTLTYDVDTHYPWLHDSDEIVVGGKLKFTDGQIQVTTTPGLGVDVDRDALARGNERFENISYRDRDDVGHMQRTVDPAWTSTLPRW
jgi:glucarate dehydratase